MLKKFLCGVLAFGACVSAMSGCGNSNGDTSTDNKKISVVCTIFPEYDWVKNIIGDNDVDLTLLLDNGTDLHNYQPTTEDMVKVSSCDVFVYVGGESDGWVDDCLKNAKNDDMQVVDLMEVMGNSAKEEEVKEGMDAEEEESGDEIEYDEHVWLSLKNAVTFCDEISKSLSVVDEKNAESYKTNCENYTAELENLHKDYTEAVNSANGGTLIFGDRFPFRYMVDDYGIDYFAAFVGCSAETEASFETIVFLAGKVDELGSPAIMTIENSDGKIANSVLENTKEKNAKILALNSMQSVTGEDIEKGSQYLEIMKDNLSVIKEALG